MLPPNFQDCILVHIACLVALRKSNALFALSHKLVDTMKDSHITWYAVGCYYYTIEQFSAAKKFLGKPLQLVVSPRLFLQKSPLQSTPVLERDGLLMVMSCTILKNTNRR